MTAPAATPVDPRIAVVDACMPTTKDNPDDRADRLATPSANVTVTPADSRRFHRPRTSGRHRRDFLGNFSDLDRRRLDFLGDISRLDFHRSLNG